MFPTDNFYDLVDAIWHKSATQWAVRAVKDTGNLLLPSSCAVCSSQDTRLCDGCRYALGQQLFLPPFPDELIHELEVPLAGFSCPVLAQGIYANELSRAILAYKEHQRFFLASFFAPYLAAGLNTMAKLAPEQSQVLLVPMPSSMAALARRGYRPVSAILDKARRRGLLDPRLRIAPLLHYPTSQLFTGAQKTRSASQRRGNQKPLQIYDSPRVRPQPIIIVDDVMTTGATLQKAVVACNLAGFEVIGANVLAWTKPPNEKQEL